MEEALQLPHNRWMVALAMLIVIAAAFGLLMLIIFKLVDWFAPSSFASVRKLAKLSPAVKERLRRCQGPIKNEDVWKAVNDEAAERWHEAESKRNAVIQRKQRSVLS